MSDQVDREVANAMHELARRVPAWWTPLERVEFYEKISDYAEDAAEALEVALDHHDAAVARLNEAFGDDHEPGDGGIAELEQFERGRYGG